jgi:hypothetical protein
MKTQRQFEENAFFSTNDILTIGYISCLKKSIDIVCIIYKYEVRIGCKFKFETIKLREDIRKIIWDRFLNTASKQKL